MDYGTVKLENHEPWSNYCLYSMARKTSYAMISNSYKEIGSFERELAEEIGVCSLSNEIPSTM